MADERRLGCRSFDTKLFGARPYGLILRCEPVTQVSEEKVVLAC